MDLSDLIKRETAFTPDRPATTFEKNLRDQARRRPVGPEQLGAHALQQLVRFKVPHNILFFGDLPRTALGGVQHFMLGQLDTRQSSQGETN